MAAGSAAELAELQRTLPLRSSEQPEASAAVNHCCRDGSRQVNLRPRRVCLFVCWFDEMKCENNTTASVVLLAGTQQVAVVVTRFEFSTRFGRQDEEDDDHHYVRRIEPTSRPRRRQETRDKRQATSCLFGRKQRTENRKQRTQNTKVKTEK